MDRPRKVRTPLTPDQQELAVQAMQYVGKIIRRATAEYRARYDFHGAVAERICLLVGRFDPTQSPLSTWAIHHAQWAIRDELRIEGLRKYRRNHAETPQTISLSTPISRRHGGHGGDTPVDVAASGHCGAHRDPLTPMEVNEDVAHLLRGLPHDARYILVESYIRGRPLREIGRDLGLGESGVSMIRTRALEFLREHRSRIA